MEEINELILFENENTRLDFKRDEYRKENYSSFLKDVISMSNANSKEDRYILIGLKPKSEDERGLIGIQGELTDSAILQQLVYENIEPEISLDYLPYKHEKYLIGVLKISNYNNPPYLMKKDYGNGKNKLYRGEGFIRKGTHQTRLTRKDYDRFTKQKNDDKYFKDEVEFTFVTNDLTNEILLKSIDDIKWPSQIKKEKIQRILKEKREKADSYEKLGLPSNLLLTNEISWISSPFGGSKSYEQRDIPTLEKNLENVEETYQDHDYYEISENQSNKCNIIIHNKGYTYIEDASIIVKIPKLKGLYIAEKIYNDPDNNSVIKENLLSSNNYPKITIKDNFYIIESSIGNIKHQKKQDAFNLEIRVFADTELENKEFNIFCELYAKNIKVSIQKELLICTKNKLRIKD